MKSIANALVVLSVVLMTTTGSATTPQSVEVTRNLTSMPLAFTENQGQWDEQVSFRANAGGATMWFTRDGAVYKFTRRVPTNSVIASDQRERGNLMGAREAQESGLPVTLSGVEGRHHQPDSIESISIKANFVGANPNPRMVGLDEMEYKCNYFIGNDPNDWHTDVPNYQAIVYEDIYSGIDLKYYGNGRQMEYDFIVSPGSDFSQIEIQYEGAESISINDNGELVVETKWGVVTELKPRVYQLNAGRHTEIECEYKLLSASKFGFSLGNGYDSRLPLVIDPVLIYSTYLGGSRADWSYAIAVDNNGSAYVTGYTYSPDFPTEDPFQTDQVEIDVFVTKLNSSGNGLIYSTYLGGGDIDWGYAIAADGNGSAYVTGWTKSSDFPTQNPYQTDQGHDDVYVTKLNSLGNGLIYSTYLGGSGTDYGCGIAVDDIGNALVSGFTESSDFPTQNPYQTDKGDGDAFVTKLDSSGSGLIYSTYLGGGGNDWSFAIAVDDSGNAYATGYTESSDFPTENPYQSDQGSTDAFVTKLNSVGNGLIYSTYLGGGNNEFGLGIAVDNNGNAYVTGWTRSLDFPTENPYQSVQDTLDAFVTKLNSMGNGLIYSTYLGGDDHDWGMAIAVNDNGNALVTGDTWSTDFPTQNPFQTDQDEGDAYVTKLNSSGNGLIFSTYLGGSSDDRGRGIAVDDSGNVFVTGATTSTDFPTENAYQLQHQQQAAFVAKLSEYCCIPPIRGNVDFDPGDVIDISDLVCTVDYMFNGGPQPVCWEEANVDGSGDGPPDGPEDIDIADLVHLVDYMFNQGPPPVPCP